MTAVSHETGSTQGATTGGTGTLSSIRVAARLARREMRGGFRGFRIFLACLTLGVAALAAIGSLSSAIVAGLKDDARAIVGGDVQIRITGRTLAPEQQAYVRSNATAVTVVREMRAMAHAANDERALVEVKAVGGAYPLFGAVQSDPAAPLSDLLAADGGRFGAVVESNLLVRLGIDVGDTIRVGDATFVINGRIVHEPDRVATVFLLGPRVLVSAAALDATGLVREGSLIYHKTRVRLEQGADVGAWVDALNGRFPDAAWRIKDVRNSQPGLKRFVDRFGIFLTLVGLTALVVGGIGIANAVKSYLDSRVETIAVLKCLGAPGPLVFRLYLIQVLAMAVIGVAIGLALGAAVPPVLAAIFADSLPFPTRTGFFPAPLAFAALYGVLTAFLFAVWPLARARDVPAAGLFRAIVAPSAGRPRTEYIVVAGVAALALAALAIIAGGQAYYTKWFVLGVIGALIVLRLASIGLVRLVAVIKRPRHMALRLAITNLGRPGATTAGVMVSLGAGLSVLTAVALLQANLAQEIKERAPRNAPAFFFIDIQPGQADAFRSLLTSQPGVKEIQQVPMLRGRVIRVNGVPSDEVDVVPGEKWVTRAEIGFSYRGEMPEGTRLTAGEWWPRDYSGPPLISLDDDVAQGMNLKLGDTMTFNILGRSVTAEIANFRVIDWSDYSVNFIVIFAPGTLEGAPQSYVANAVVDPAKEDDVYATMTGTFANVSAIRVRDVFVTLMSMLGRIVTAVNSTAVLAILSGVLVLSGAIAAGHRRRVYDSVILKVLGATRWDVMRAYALEYALVGLLAAAIAIIVGWVAAYFVVTEIMNGEWTNMPAVAALTALGGLVITVSIGLVGTYRALAHKPMPVLRSD